MFGAMRTRISRGRALALLERLPGSASGDSPDKRALFSVSREVGPGRLFEERQSVTTLLYERLRASDVAEIEKAIEEHDELAGQYTPAGDAAKRQMVLTFGAWLEVPALSERTALPTSRPPDDVHAMARGPLAAAGGLYEADMVADSLLSAGIAIGDTRSALDFGCSSGRVVRVLATAYPQTEWWGCDPNAPAIAWAQANLTAGRFFASSNVPPLELPEASLDLVYAISIWSHFEPRLGLRWFDEMHRLLRAGGHLVLTTHGLTSVAFYAEHGLRPIEQSREIAETLYRTGWWYGAEFGPEGDWGVVSDSWGTAFLTPEWLIAQLCPRWRVLEFAPGRNQQNQDVFVLQRV